MRRASRAQWMGPGGAARLAPAIMTAAAVLIAGCGQVPSGDLSPRGRPAVAQAREPAGGPPTGSRSQARAFAQGLLSRLILPPGAREVRLRALPPQQLPQPSIPSGGTHRADVHGLFLLRQPMGTVQGFLEAHVPAGMRLFSYSLSAAADPGVPPRLAAGRTADPSSATMESVSFEPRSWPIGIYVAELDTAIVTGANGGSILRADAAVIWYPHRSAAEYVDPLRARAVRIWVQLFNPRTRAVVRTVTSSAVIGGLARLVDGLPAAPYQPPGCPAIVATFRFTFVPAVPAAPRVVVSPSGCMTVGITVGGVAQPVLWGDERLIRLAMRLLQLRSLV